MLSGCPGCRGHLLDYNARRFSENEKERIQQHPNCYLLNSLPFYTLFHIKYITYKDHLKVSDPDFPNRVLHKNEIIIVG